MLRQLSTEDRSPVLELLRSTGNFSAAELEIAEELIEAILNDSEQGEYYGFVEDSSGIRGFAVVGPVPATAGTWDLFWIAVSPTWYGTGVAQELQAHAEEYVRARNGYLLLVETSGQPSYGRSRGFYRKQGFRELARVPDYYKPGDDLILFGKRLDL